jgi:hypothetical protein
MAICMFAIAGAGIQRYRQIKRVLSLRNADMPVKVHRHRMLVHTATRLAVVSCFT